MAWTSSIELRLNVPRRRERQTGREAIDDAPHSSSMRLPECMYTQHAAIARHGESPADDAERRRRGKNNKKHDKEASAREKDGERERKKEGLRRRSLCGEGRKMGGGV